jgi:hypothetical protein
MQLPLPTDSLYKFMALAGISVALASATITAGSFIALDTRVETLNGQTDSLAVEVRYLESDLQWLQTRYHIPLDSALPLDCADGITPTAAQIPCLALADLRARTKSVRLAANAQTRRGTQARHLVWVTVTIGIFGTLFLTLGIVLAYNGFRLWHDRIQQFVDKQMAASASNGT